jgi:hypothetical protein
MAKQPLVKCPGCGEEFDRDIDNCIHIKNRYWHKDCYKQKIEPEEYRQRIHDYCKKKYGSQYSQRRISQQINEMIKDGKDTPSIYRALVYWYEIKNGDIEKSHGSIRIINYIYDEAMEYYSQKFRLQAEQAQLQKGSLDLGTETFYISPTPIKRPKRVRLFDIK